MSAPAPGSCACIAMLTRRFSGGRFNKSVMTSELIECKDNHKQVYSPYSHQPWRAALIAATSIFFMSIIAVKTRLRTALIKVRRANQDKERP